MRKQFQSFKFLSLSLLLLLCGCSTASPRSPQKAGVKKTESAESSENGLRILTIGTADSGGTMYPVGYAIAQIISEYDEQIKVNISASNGSYTNVQGIQNGQIDLGLVSGDVAFSAYNGKEDFSEKPATGLRAIGAVYSSISNWITPDTSGIEYVHELKGKRVAVGPQGSTTDLSARIALKAAGLDASNTILKNYGLGSGGTEVERGNIDALHGFAGIPIHGLDLLAQSIPCHFLKYTDEELDRILSSESSYYRTVIPAGTYPGQEQDIETFGVKCLVCVSEDMDENLVYLITRILHESVPQLARNHESMAAMEEEGFMYRELPIPLHSGAEKYYQEAGLLLPDSGS